MILVVKETYGLPVHSSLVIFYPEANTMREKLSCITDNQCVTLETPYNSIQLHLVR